MKTESEKLKLRLFFGALVIIGLAINSQFNSRPRSRPSPAPQTWQEPHTEAHVEPRAEVRHEPSQETSSQPSRAQLENEIREAAAKKALQDAATERANLSARYLNAEFSRKPGLKVVAVAVASEDKRLNRTLADALAARFKTNSVEMSISVFKPEFVADGRISQALEASDKPLGTLEPPHSVDALLFARQDVQYSTNPSLENTITASMQLEVAFFSFVGTTDQRWTFKANGAGFSQKDARQMAEERLTKQIIKDTSMVLMPEFIDSKN